MARLGAKQPEGTLVVLRPLSIQSRHSKRGLLGGHPPPVDEVANTLRTWVFACPRIYDALWPDIYAYRQEAEGKVPASDLCRYRR